MQYIYPLSCSKAKIKNIQLKKVILQVIRTNAIAYFNPFTFVKSKLCI